MTEYCCEDFKRAVEGEDEIFLLFSSSGKYEINAYDMVEDFVLNFCPFCGVKLE